MPGGNGCELPLTARQVIAIRRWNEPQPMRKLTREMGVKKNINYNLHQITANMSKLDFDSKITCPQVSQQRSL